MTQTYSSGRNAQPIMSYTIYHNPRCSKCRATLALLEEAHIEPQVIEYLNAPPSVDELDDICRKLGVEPQAIIRFGEDLANSLGISSQDQRTRKEWLQLLAEHPVLLERPIVIHGDEARIGRPPAAVQELFD